MKLILLSGPPRSGKDTSAWAIHDHINANQDAWKFWCEHEKFSFPHKAAFAMMLTVQFDLSTFKVEYYEDHKDEIIPELGFSFRQWQIDFSEKFMKPLYGNDIFGKLLLLRLDGAINFKAQAGIMDESCFVISDCGFQIEVDTLLDAGAQEGDILAIDLYRDGTDYSKDSRGRVDFSSLGKNWIKHQNHSDAATLIYEVKQLAETFIRED